MNRTTPKTAVAAAMVIAVWLTVTGAFPVLAAERVALVIGNASYAHAPALANPLNDAADVGAALERLGFTVTRLADAGDAEMRHSLKKFRRGAGVAKVAVVFYAGHGVEMNKRNFLVPVDARLQTDGDVEFEAVPLDLVMSAVEGASEFRLVVLDACRDNPFLASMKREKGSTRSIGRGLARSEPSGGGTLLAYSAKEGTVALDGTGRNSPYTSALLRYVEEPGLDVGLMFRKVRDAVLEATGWNQEPFAYGSLSARGAYFIPPTNQGPAEGAPAMALGSAVEVEHWKTINTIKDPAARIAALLDYKAKFPGGVYTDLAEIRLQGLKASSAPQAPMQAMSSEAVEAAIGLTREDRRRIQHALRAIGFDPGSPDGLFGGRTRSAISAWQTAEGMPSTGYLQVDAVKALLERVTEPRREAMQVKPSSIVLASGLRLSDWAMLAEDRLAEHDYRKLLVEGARHLREHGPHAPVENVVERAVAGMLAEVRVTDDASARSALATAKRIRDVAGDRADLDRVEARAYVRLGQFPQAVEAYRSWLRLVPADHPMRRNMLAQMRNAERGERGQVVGERIRDCAECPELVVVASGTFEMGSPKSERGRESDEGPVHRVGIPEPFAVGVYEVTFAQWEACRHAGGCTHNPDDQEWGRGTRPVMNVSWADAQSYVNWLSSMTGKEYRLPSESEWEYVARAGTRTRYWWGDEQGRGRSNCNGCAERQPSERTSPVGSFSANGFGLHDVHGNVQEWVEDCWHRGYVGAPRDGSAWTTGGNCTYRVVRGGSWFNWPRGLRSANRVKIPTKYRVADTGIRVARALD